MSKLFKRWLCVFFATVITLLAIAVLPFISYNSPEVFNNKKMVGAVADLSEYDIDGGNEVYLAGEWQFFWDELIISENNKPATDNKVMNIPSVVQLPSSWTTYKINGEKLNNGGNATYKATIKNVRSSEPVIISLPNMPGQYKIYIDNILVCSNCSNSTDIGSSTNDTTVYTYPVILNYSPDNTYEVIIEVSCDYSSGITVIPILSTYDAYTSRTFSAIALRYMVVGIVLFFIVVAIMFNMLMKRNVNFFWLIILCLAFVFRLIICGEGYMVSHSAFFNVSYEIIISIVYILTYIIELAVFMYITTALEIRIPQPFIVLITSVILVCSFVPYFLYDRIYIATSFIWLQCFIFPLVLYLIYKLSVLVIDKKKDSLIYLFAFCFTSAALVVDSFYLNGFIAKDVSFVFPLACIIFISVCIFINISKTVQAYSGAKRAAELTKELSDVNMTLMLSQIQPHFLYNALNTIKHLTKKDPKAAENAIVRFSGYLRANMNSLTQKDPIAFSKELEHVKNYVEIEKMRFGDRLRVEYNIEFDDFTIPPLTIQPIVENAIKHGINQKVDGGVVTVSSYETDKDYIVTIADNGIGYEAKDISDNSHEHVGLQNIKIRLKELLDATVTVTSAVNEGTTVTVSIPKH